MNNYLGIDPGLNGGFALISKARVLHKLAMPTTSIKKKDGTTKKEIDHKAVLLYLETAYIYPSFIHVAVEEQHPARNQNITSTCTLCQNYGMLKMALIATKMDFIEIPSNTWQSYFGIVSVNKGEGTTKEQAFHIAQRLYPTADFRRSDRSHKAHDGMVDAVLIANYCLFSVEGEKNEK